MDNSVYRPSPTIEFGSPIPLYHQIRTRIEADIVSGVAAPNVRLEDETSMASRLEVSRQTVRQALQQLVDRELIVRRRGTGTWIAPPRVSRPFSLTSLSDDLSSSGNTPSTRVLEYEAIVANAEEAERFTIPVASPLVRFKRLRLADGEPLAVMHNVVPAEIAPSWEELETRGLYEHLRDTTLIARADQVVTARIADTETAQLLDERQGAPILEVQRTSYGTNGQFIEFGRHTYRGSMYSMHSTIVPSMGNNASDR